MIISSCVYPVYGWPHATSRPAVLLVPEQQRDPVPGAGVGDVAGEERGVSILVGELLHLGA